ncbi:two-component system sensor histidine kinase DegS [Salsuginibacillus halophilus]|uniref:Signal transduction histidine-protein kinase/phosphatase DegS n=1 Tax=Salsuginibacillus halophilus TaxID=517424 RepID=A0A2P8HQR2_9BACI|nr:sensor histidine kinase [Salsuginibacillus halophilus]PSL48560.1 two-component system sensor histidine kinase DegS [Salsuginibacillus halophilus]
MTEKPSLDQIIEQMLSTVEESKEQIFEISEQSRQEYETLTQELEQVQAQVGETIDRVDALEKNARLARNRLAAMSKDFTDYSNDDVRRAYEAANELQVQLAVERQNEQQLRERRDQLERRLVQLEDTLNRAEGLVGQVAVVQNFLNGDLREIGDMVADAQEKQAFGLKIIEAQEEERKRVARDIHDGPAQMLANIMLRSELVERVYQEQGVDQALAEIQDIRSLVKTSLGEVRRIIYDLRPMALDDLGLVPTLEKYLRNIQENTDLDIRFTQHGKDQRLPANMEVGLFRLVQEAVHNTLKHAEATYVHIKAELLRTKATIIVEDDGVGFDEEEKEAHSFGLIGMRERVENLRGELTIQSTPHQGTTIHISVPVGDGEEAEMKHA